MRGCIGRLCCKVKWWDSPRWQLRCRVCARKPFVLELCDKLEWIWKKQLERRANVPDFSTTCRSGDGKGGGVGSSTDCNWTWGGFAGPGLTSSVIFIRRWGYKTAVRPSSLSSSPLPKAAKTLVIWANTPTSCTELISVMTSLSVFSSLSRKAPKRWALLCP